MRSLAGLLIVLLLPVHLVSAQLAQKTPIAGIQSADPFHQDSTAAQSRPESSPILEEAEPSLYYLVSREAMMYRQADSTQPYVNLKFRDPVHLVGHQGRWSEVRTTDGARGYILSGQLSNTWIRVSKSQKTVFVYQGAELFAEIPADLGYNTFYDKERRGSTLQRDHWRTPEGTFYVVGKNPRSQFYKAFVLNYPTAGDAAEGLRNNLISDKEYAAIVRADQEGTMPPMNTALGGMIEIHGHGTGGRTNWTQGCIAVSDAMMDRLWSMVEIGTPVLVEP